MIANTLMPRICVDRPIRGDSARSHLPTPLLDSGEGVWSVSVIRSKPHNYDMFVY